MKEKRGIQNIVTIRIWSKSAQSRPDQVINLAVERGISIWELQEEKEGRWRLSVGAAQTRPLLRLAQKNGCGTKIIDKRGPGFLLGRMRRRKSLVFAVGFFLLALFIATRFIWFVDIQCENPRLALTVKNQLSAGGVMPGSLKSAIGPDYIRLLLKTNPDVSWVGVEFQGSRLLLEVVERKEQSDPSMAGGADLVAKEAGEVTEILVLQGQARVKPGDMVQKGQVLIAGSAPAAQPGGTGAESSAAQERARYQKMAKGMVRAKISRRIAASCPLLEEVHQDTGNQVTWYRLVVEDDKSGLSSSWRLNGLNQQPFSLYRQVTNVRVIWQNQDGDKRLKLVTTSHKEQAAGYIRRSLEEAAERCRELAYEELAQTAGKDYRVLTEEFETAEDSGQGTIRLVFNVDTIELIGGTIN